MLHIKIGMVMLDLNQNVWQTGSGNLSEWSTPVSRLAAVGSRRGCTQ